MILAKRTTNKTTGLTDTAWLRLSLVGAEVNLKYIEKTIILHDSPLKQLLRLSQAMSGRNYTSFFKPMANFIFGGICCPN